MSATLYVGNRNYSSWSMRGSLLVRQSGLECREVVIPLDTAEGRAKLREVSPTHKVPALHHEGRVVWESVALAEYLHERFPERDLWPEDGAARALARCVSAEMHAGFMALRQRMPLDVRARVRLDPPGEDVRKDVRRIEQIWTSCRAEFGAGGDYLFGRWCAADAMFAPVVSRFRTYGVALG
ncbi:MAG TPA: glutathione S-transferase family protein, partial [Gammaproteobacteria bacterium]|nr:glutathione S-transferase family protein [Gammaproteobacteria bacterium]